MSYSSHHLPFSCNLWVPLKLSLQIQKALFSSEKVLRSQHVPAEKLFKDNETSDKLQASLWFRTICTSEPCQFTTTNCHVFKDWFQKWSHFDIFSKINYQPYCRFWTLTFNGHNFKPHTDSKSISTRDVKFILASSKWQFSIGIFNPIERNELTGLLHTLYPPSSHSWAWNGCGKLVYVCECTILDYTSMPLHLKGDAVWMIKCKPIVKDLSVHLWKCVRRSHYHVLTQIKSPSLVFSSTSTLMNQRSKWWFYFGCKWSG